MSTNKQEKIDSKAFMITFTAFFLGMGFYLTTVSGKMYYHIFTIIGAMMAFSSFKIKNDYKYKDETKRKNLILGIIISILTILILWITFENRFNLETMAKTKGI
jgi:4-hydroxybenzoate polyprenyltransferase